MQFFSKNKKYLLIEGHTFLEPCRYADKQIQKGAAF